MGYLPGKELLQRGRAGASQRLFDLMQLFDIFNLHLIFDRDKGKLGGSPISIFSPTQ